MKPMGEAPEQKAGAAANIDDSHPRDRTVCVEPPEFAPPNAVLETPEKILGFATHRALGARHIEFSLGYRHWSSSSK
jgi:hypothetical protein